MSGSRRAASGTSAARSRSTRASTGGPRSRATCAPRRPSTPPRRRRPARSAPAGARAPPPARPPAALAQAGVSRTGGQRALPAAGRARLEGRAARPAAVALTYLERTVLFEDGTGGAMHAPGVEALRRIDERLTLGAAYAFGA